MYVRMHNNVHVIILLNFNLNYSQIQSQRAIRASNFQHMLKLIVLKAPDSLAVHACTFKFNHVCIFIQFGWISVPMVLN